MNTVCTGDGNVKALKVLDLNAGLGGRIFAFEKAGFKFESEHPDGDAWNYRYKR